MSWEYERAMENAWEEHCEAVDKQERGATVTQQVWQPVDDGEISSFMYVDNGGKLVGVFAGDDYTDWYATEDLPDNIRLCRLTPVDDASVIPAEVVEAMNIVTILLVDLADYVWIYENENEMHALGENYRHAAKDIRAWLERTQGAK